MNPAISFGPTGNRRHRHTCFSLYERYKAGDSVANLAQDFRLDTSAIEDAIRYEGA